jgi:glycosyltransferase involved in cell wall biosynthesis
VIYNFIDIETFIPKKSKDELRQEFGVSDLDFIIGSVGRIVKEKGYDILLQAMNLLRERGYSFKCIIVGDGKYLDTLKSNARTANLSKDVIFTGFRSDIADILQIFDIFALPTLDEGFGISIIEAQIMGLPVIASSVDAIPEIIQNGYNGLLVPPNDPYSLANEMEYLYKNAGRRSEIGIKARESVVERFSASVGVKNLDDLYTQLTHKQI